MNKKIIISIYETLFSLPIFGLLYPFRTFCATKRDVNGVIYMNSECLYSATVIEWGTVNGVSTDFDGNYSIEVLKGATLEYSYVGYKLKLN